MTTQEQLKAKRQEMKDFAEKIRDLRKNNLLQYEQEKQALQQQYNALYNEEENLRYKRYLELCNCKHCQDSGYITKCCSDNDCQGNVICYECDIHLTNEEE